MVYKTTNVNKKVIYPIFVKCSEQCSDPFWKKLYLSFSINKPPKTLYISNGYINSINKNKKQVFSYNFESKSPDDIISELNNLIMENTSLISNKDMIKKHNEMEQMKESMNVDNPDWKSVKKKKVKNLYIANFCNEMRIKYKLDWDSTTELCNLIKTGLLLKLQTKNDIEFKDGRILNINGIVYNKKLKKFLNINTAPVVKMKNEDLIDNCLYYYWPKLVLNINDQYKCKA